MDNTCLALLEEAELLFIGYSGGLDSSLLLTEIAQLPAMVTKTVAIHINHGLSPHAAMWQQHCEKTCAALGIPLLVKQITLTREGNLEARARKARYDIFAQLMQKQEVLLLGHHQDDQAETLFLNLLRGAGIEGLAAMPLSKSFAQGKMIRPFLNQSKNKILQRAQALGIAWIEDESNQSLSYRRNFLRHQIIPLLTTRWKSVVNTLSRSSAHCQLAQSNLEDLAYLDCPSLKIAAEKLNIAELEGLSHPRLLNVLRMWLRLQAIKLPSSLILQRILHELLLYNQHQGGGTVAWGKYEVKRYDGMLYLLKIKPMENSLFYRDSQVIKPTISWINFPQPLVLPNQKVLSAQPAKQGLAICKGSKIEVRFREGGETFSWHGQTKKLKKLMQSWKVPSWERETIPLLYINNKLACIVNYAISDAFYEEQSGEAPIFTISY